VLVDEVLDLACCTRPDRVRDQRIRWGFVLVLHCRKNMHHTRLCSSFITGQLSEAYQFVTDKRPDPDTPVKKGCRFPADSLQILPKMTKRLSLPYGTFVVDSPNTPDENIVKRDLA